MSSIYDKFVCPIIKLLIIAFAKLIFDILVLTAAGWEYTNFIFFEALFASCCLCLKYIKQSKKQQEETGVNTRFNFLFFKNIHYKIYKSRFIKFLKDNKVILLFLFLSNGNLLSIIESSNKEFFPMINKIEFKNENLANYLLDFLRFLNNDQNLVNFLFSCYFCLIVWIFINQIDFQLLETVSSHKESGNDKK